jgi:hypothetical protein
MNTQALEEIPATIDIIPKFSDLAKTPKSGSEGIWIIGAAAIPLVIWSLKEGISGILDAAKQEHKAKLEEQRLELVQRDSLIKHLQEQNNKLINEIFILRRTMDYSGDLTNEAVKLKNAKTRQTRQSSHPNSRATY